MIYFIFIFGFIFLFLIGLIGRDPVSSARLPGYSLTLHLPLDLVLLEPHPPVVRQLVGEDGHEEHLGHRPPERLVKAGLMLLRRYKHFMSIYLRTCNW